MAATISRAPGFCGPACTCVPECNGTDLSVLKLRTTRSLALRATLDDANGRYDGLDPRPGLTLTLTPVDRLSARRSPRTIPAGADRVPLRARTGGEETARSPGCVA